jgi:hypothetical protein
MRQTKEGRKSYFSRLANELALSGRYNGWQQIEYVLRHEAGYVQARDGLDNPFRRDWLDRLCQQRQKRLAMTAES